MTNSEISAFIAVCKDMSISRAAEKLFISQSSLSTKIKTLEDELGYSLFKRGRGQRTLKLTAEGESFYELALKYRDIVDSMMAIGNKKEPLSLNISTGNSMGNYLFAQVYDVFMKNNPQIALKIQDHNTNTAYENISKGYTDIAFTIKRLDYPGIDAYPIFSEKMELVCAKNTDLPDCINFKDLDIKNEVYVPWTDTFVDWHKVALGNPDNTQIKVELMAQLHYFLAKENSWAIVPSSVANHMTRDENIVKKELVFDVPKRMCICAFDGDVSKRKLVNAFLESIKEVLEDKKEYDIELFI
ncbi:MAG: LysR family transcriptional regulator [Firmicutes bacterium]|nr:LysR family transcriptional regulator [Bacillota bacterium]